MENRLRVCERNESSTNGVTTKLLVRFSYIFYVNRGFLPRLSNRKKEKCISIEFLPQFWTESGNLEQSR